jgi:hypothetical protein
VHLHSAYQTAAVSLANASHTHIYVSFRGICVSLCCRRFLSRKKQLPTAAAKGLICIVCYAVRTPHIASAALLCVGLEACRSIHMVCCPHPPRTAAAAVHVPPPLLLPLLLAG